MKKVLIGLAAVGLSAAVFADVTSQNIVGYGPTTLPADGLAVGASFVNVTQGAPIDLTDIIVKGYDPFDYESEEGGAYGDVTVQTLTGGGSTDVLYVWLDFVEKGDTPADDVVWKGWYDFDTEEPLVKGDVVLAPGEGLWSVTTIEDMHLQTSGEVATKADVGTALPADGMMIANPTPVSVDLTNCYITGYDPYDYDSEEGGAYGDATVQTLTGGGSTDVLYVWLDFVEKGDTPADDVVWHGWYNFDTEEPLEKDDVVLAPGEGLWSVTTIEDMVFNWPKVDVK